MTTESDAAQRREHARDRATGQFGEHEHSDPELTLDGPADDDEPWVPTYEMPKSALPEALKRIERANRRLTRAGVDNQFTYELEEYIHREEGDPFGVAAVRLTLNAPVISSGEWTFTAAHEETADGHIISYGSAKVDEMRCDHCGHKRRRGKVYTVTNKDGETMVVGSNCLSLFLGVRPEGLWALSFGLDAPGDEEDADEPWSIGSRTGDLVLPAVDLIAVGLAASNDGKEFVPKSKASMRTPPTAEVVARDLHALIPESQEPARRAAAENILSWVNEQPEGESDFIDNLRSVLAGDERWVGRKHFGIGVAAIVAHRNALEWAARDSENANAYSPGHVGMVGERFRDLPMTVAVVDVSEDMYGPKTRLVFRDDTSGRQVIWWASGDRGELSPGDKVTVTGTVKEHSAYRDTDQTVITRGVYKA